MIKILPITTTTKTKQNKQIDKNTKWLHWWILPNTERRIAIPSQTFLQYWREKNSSKVILWDQHYPEIKATQGHYKQSKTEQLQANSPIVYRGKIFNKMLANCIQQNIRWRTLAYSSGVDFTWSGHLEMPCDFCITGFY